MVGSSLKLTSDINPQTQESRKKSRKMQANSISQDTQFSNCRAWKIKILKGEKKINTSNDNVRTLLVYCRGLYHSGISQPSCYHSMTSGSWSVLVPVWTNPLCHRSHGCTAHKQVPYKILANGDNHATHLHVYSSVNHHFRVHSY